ncbi:MAG: alanine racemase [Methyloligellaceae bacterium]
MSRTAAQATALLTIDLNALRANYSHLKQRATPAECAAVVKADAYGIGLEQAVAALTKEGCKTFFVATLAEATRLRTVNSEAVVYVLDGLFPETAPLFVDSDVRPVLNSLDEIEEWSRFCVSSGTPREAAVHIDSGMNRLGLGAEEVAALSGKTVLLDSFKLSLVMSHLACADAPVDRKNTEQFNHFQSMRERFNETPACFANSAGIFLGGAYRFDMVRAGISLYGGNAILDQPEPMKPVVRLDGRIAQIRSTKPGETIGYGAAQSFRRASRIATVTLGYADGFMRLLGASDTQKGATAYIDDYPAPLLGRVSMDLITIDVTDIPEELVKRGGFVELIGPHVTVDDLATQAQTIGYEILTSLGRRYQRVYLGED